MSAREVQLRVPVSDPEVQWTLLDWRQRDGHSFDAGAALVDLIGPDGVVTLRAESKGRIRETLVDPGGVVDSGETVAILAVEGQGAE